MYKTVRRGEMSLQYTILPQTEEALSGGGLKGKGRDFSPAGHDRRRPRSAAKCLLSVAIGLLVLMALATIPLFIINGSLFMRRHRHDAHALCAPHTPQERELIKSRKKELKVLPVVATETPEPASERPTPPWSLPAVRSWRDGATTAPPTPVDFLQGVPRIGAPRMSLVDKTPRPREKDAIIRPTLTPTPKPTPTTVGDVFRLYSPTPAPVAPRADDVLISTRAPADAARTNAKIYRKFKDMQQALLDMDDDEDFNAAMVVDGVFTMVTTPPRPNSEPNEVTIKKAEDGYWYLTPWANDPQGDRSMNRFLVGMSLATFMVLWSVMVVATYRRRCLLLSTSYKIPPEAITAANTKLLRQTEEADE